MTFCSGDTTEQKYCSAFHMCGTRRVCPKVPEFSRPPTECYYEPKPEMFSCLNRMDKYPEIFAQSLYREDPLKLNKDFMFNSSGIQCNGDKLIPWTWKQLYDIRIPLPCQSKTGRNISITELLIRDMGFKGRKHILENSPKQKYVKLQSQLNM